MNRNRHFRIAFSLFLVLLALPRLHAAQTAAGDGGIVSRSADVANLNRFLTCLEP